MKKRIRLTEYELTRFIKNVINEGAIEDMSQAVEAQKTKPTQPLTNNFNLKMFPNNILQVSPINSPKTIFNYQLSFLGRSSFKIINIDFQGCNGHPYVAFRCKNGDFPLSWGLFKPIEGAWGFVKNKKDNKWVKENDVVTDYLGRINYEVYGYKNRDDVELQIQLCSDNEVLTKVFEQLKSKKFAQVEKGIPLTDLKITIKKV